LSNDPKIAFPSMLAAPPINASLSTPTQAFRPEGARPNKHDELRLLVNSRHPIITIETPEEERVEEILFDIVTEMGVPLYT